MNDNVNKLQPSTIRRNMWFKATNWNCAYLVRFFPLNFPSPQPIKTYIRLSVWHGNLRLEQQFFPSSPNLTERHSSCNNTARQLSRSTDEGKPQVWGWGGYEHLLRSMIGCLYALPSDTDWIKGASFQSNNLEKQNTVTPFFLRRNVHTDIRKSTHRANADKLAALPSFLSMVKVSKCWVPLIFSLMLLNFRR